jgi:predicted RNA-binding Zn-ribbon protein involved in translation (DUF1610 family)
VTVTFLHRIRLRIFAVLLGVGLTAFVVVAWTTIPAWPVVGVAFAAVAMAVNQMASKLTQPVCHGCGRDINGMAVGQYGVVCPSCGFVTQRLALKVDAAAGVDAKTGVETKTPDQV